MPTTSVTAPAFGGPNHDILFVPSVSFEVTFSNGIPGDKLKKPAGNVFAVRGLLHKGDPPRKALFQANM